MTADSTRSVIRVINKDNGIFVRYYMKKLLLIVITLMTNVGCLTMAKKIKGPSGREQLVITCRQISHCYERARKECGSDFIVVDRFYSSDQEGSVIELVIVCKQSTHP